MCAAYGTRLKRRTFLCAIVFASIASVANAQTDTIEGMVHTGVEAGCLMLDDIHTSETFELYGALPGVGECVVASGSVSGLFTFCMQGTPFDVTHFAPSSACNWECMTDVECDDGDVCTQDMCNAWDHTCAYTIMDPCCPADGPCHDGNPCTLDWSCDGAGMCNYPPYNDGATCNDGSGCTLNDACLAGICEGTPECVVAIDCDDGDPCTIDACFGGCCSPSDCFVVGDLTNDGLIDELDFSEWLGC